MADPVGITGTAIGIVSFGLQLYTGISEYLDAVKGRNEDLQHAKQYAKILRDNLRSIEETLSAIGTGYGVARHAIEQCKSSCETELKGLEILLQELKGPIVDPTNRTEQVKKSFHKFSYPFKKKDITRLQDRLSSTSNVLNTAALALQLAMSNSTCTTIAKLQKTVNVMHKTSEDTASSIAKQTMALEQAGQTMTKSHHEIQLTSQRMSTSLDIRIDEIIAHLRNTESPRSQVIHLLEYPEDLRRLCDAVSTLRQSSKANPRTLASQLTGATTSRALANYQSCACATRQDVRRQGRRLGLLFYENESQKTTYHAPECHLSGIIPTVEKNRRTVGVRIPGMLRCLSRTIRFSFSLRTGAGGLTICQSINYTATVDENSSLSFRIANMLIRLMKETSDGFRNEDFSLIAGSCIRRLSLCYRNKLASPRDVNEHGESILDLLAWQLHSLGELTIPAHVVSFVLRSFAATRIPFTNSSRANTAKIPFFILVGTSSWLSEAGGDHETVAALLSCCDMPTGQDHRVQDFLFGHLTQLEVFYNFPEIANNLGFNPLHVAIIQQDEHKVQSLLKRYPSYMNEVNYCGRSPVHVAIQSENLDIFSAVVLAANANILNTADNEGDCPIDMATRVQWPFYDSLHEQGMPCAQATMLDLLLKSKAMLLNSFMGARFDMTCQHTQMVILSHLAHRRRDLELLAISELSAVELHGLGLCNGRTLDLSTAKVQHYLAKRCRIPVELLFYREDHVSGQLGYPRSIYQYISDLDVAEYAMSLGFDAGTMLSEFFFHLIHDIAFNSRFGNFVMTFGYGWYPERIGWMIHNGADIATAIPTGFASGAVPKSTWAHYLMALFGFGARWGRDLDWKLPQNAAEIGASQVVVDGCLCWCSGQGCTPLLKFLAALDWPRIPGRNPEALESYSLRASKVLEDILPGYKLGELHYRWTYRAILRYITFTALDLRHTCCELAHKGSKPIMDAEEVREIHEEDAVQLQMLEKLVSDFETEYESHSDLASFLRDTWVPKMQHVCAELNSSHLTSQEIRSAERVGVVWVWKAYESEDTWDSGEGEYVNREGWAKVDDSMFEMDRTKDDKPSTVEEWMRRLDDIAIDPERPLITM